MSMGYLNQEGIVGGKESSNYSRYNFRINSDHKLFNGLITVGEQASFIYTKKRGIDVGNIWANGLHASFPMSPILPAYFEDGSYANTNSADFNQNAGNPFGLMKVNTNNKSVNATFSGNVYARIEPLAGLEAAHGVRCRLRLKQMAPLLPEIQVLPSVGTDLRLCRAKHEQQPRHDLDQHHLL